MAKYANFTGLVTLKKDSQDSFDMAKDTVSLREGDVYQDDDPIVIERPEFFTDTEPNSQVAGAFPIEGTLRNSDLRKGDIVEEKRWEGERPPGYETSDADRSPTAADELREEGEPARKRSAAAGTVERATAAPGEKRSTVRPSSKGKEA